MLKSWQRLIGKTSDAKAIEIEELAKRVDQFKTQGGPAIEAHAHSSSNRSELEKSSVAGCFYCCEVFTPAAIEDWLPEGSGTAWCPKCGIDSVIGDASGFPAGDRAFLKEMNGLWF